MKFIYGGIAIFLWVIFLAGTGMEMSAETVALTCATVAAGAMAGGA